MAINAAKLKQIIKEELKRALKEEGDKSSTGPVNAPSDYYFLKLVARKPSFNEVYSAILLGAQAGRNSIAHMAKLESTLDSLENESFFEGNKPNEKWRMVVDPNMPTEKANAILNRVKPFQGDITIKDLYVRDSYGAYKKMDTSDPKLLEFANRCAALWCYVYSARSFMRDPDNAKLFDQNGYFMGLPKEK